MNYRRSNEQSLGDAIDSFLKQTRLKSRQEELDVIAIWEDVMGSVIAKHTTSIDLRRKILYVKLDSASLRHELNLGKEKVVRMMNEKVGSDVINNMRLL
ncbi:MAG: putative nucleic acid-binding Zn ribbon protein [Patiriisocius sp.]|jgi:predicted nucleic acid-binding Zn ribbon protein